MLGCGPIHSWTWAWATLQIETVGSAPTDWNIAIPVGVVTERRYSSSASRLRQIEMPRQTNGSVLLCTRSACSIWGGSGPAPSYRRLSSGARSGGTRPSSTVMTDEVDGIAILGWRGMPPANESRLGCGGRLEP